MVGYEFLFVIVGFACVCIIINVREFHDYHAQLEDRARHADAMMTRTLAEQRRMNQAVGRMLEMGDKPLSQDSDILVGDNGRVLAYAFSRPMKRPLYFPDSSPCSYCGRSPQEGDLTCRGCGAPVWAERRERREIPPPGPSNVILR
jgi:hypothetical protein